MQADRASNWDGGDGGRGQGGRVGRALHLAGQEGHKACPCSQPLFYQIINNSPLTLSLSLSPNFENDLRLSPIDVYRCF